MRPTLQTVPENSTATANQTTATTAAVPMTPNGARGSDSAAEKMTPSSNHTATPTATTEKPTATHQPPQAQQLQPVKARSSARVSQDNFFIFSFIHFFIQNISLSFITFGFVRNRCWIVVVSLHLSLDHNICNTLRMTVVWWGRTLKSETRARKSDWNLIRFTYERAHNDDRVEIVKTVQLWWWLILSFSFSSSSREVHIHQSRRPAWSL